MKGKSVTSCNLALLLLQWNAAKVAGFSCNDYSGGSASSEFCVSHACEGYCADQELPGHCMELNYLSRGYCVQVSGAPASTCLGVVGIDEAHTVWCQTTGCDYAKSLGKTSLEDITASILAEYPHHCRAAGALTSQSSPLLGCFAMPSWTASDCAACAAPSGGTCPEFGWTPCSGTYEACLAAHGLPGHSTCYARTSWASNADCKVCESPASNQCSAFGYTNCFGTYDGCMAGANSPIDPAPPSVDSTTAKPPVPPVLNTTTTTTSRTTSKTTTTTSSTTTTTKANGGGGGGSSTGCWAPTSWSSSACAQCSNPSANQCPSFGYTTCYTSEADCSNAGASSGGGNNDGGNNDGGNSGADGSADGGSSGGTGACATSCPENTLAGGITRPTFKGPSCYNSEYGSNFGPNWVPSGKTRVEKFLPTPNDFMRLIRTLEAGDTMPIMTKSWGLRDCPAATAAWETFICALELMEVHGKEFDPVGNAPGYKVSDLFNTGDEFYDKLELAAFFSHKMKEVARFQVWEEAAQGYTDCTNPDFPCGAGQSYHGRGPVQISWNYNYGPFSQWWYGDKSVLLNNADKVDPEGPMGFIAAFWFWATPRQFTSGAPISGNLRTRDAIIHWTSGKLNSMYNDGVDYDSYAGLGLSTNVINGGIECTGNFDSPARRVEYFLTTIGRLGLTIPHVNENAACLSDPLCYGLYRGCSSTRSGAKCTAVTGVCGDATDYVRGWNYNGCSPP